MSGLVLRRGLLAPVLLAAIAGRAAAQQAGKTQGFPTADAAATALTEAVRKDDDKAIAAMLGEWWRVFVPNRERDFGRDRTLFLAAWDDSHKVNVDGDKAIVEVGKTGWTLPIPIVKDGAEWRFESEAGIDELGAREIGRDELGAIQTLLAIVDAQRDYAAMDPMKTGSPVYARRLKSLPGKKDGLYWPASPASPRARWANWSPTRRTTASRRAAITATISACSTPRARRRRAARSTTW
jgi:hypothetical protein